MNDDAARTTPNDVTRDSERRDAEHGREPGAGPTAEEEAAAERGKSELTREAAESYEEYLERAAKARGEGQIP